MRGDSRKDEKIKVTVLERLSMRRGLGTEPTMTGVVTEALPLDYTFLHSNLSLIRPKLIAKSLETSGH